MGKYSSESDGEKHGGKSSYKSSSKHSCRSSSLSSTESRSRRKKRKSDRHQSRGHSRDKYSKSRRSRSGSSYKSKSGRSSHGKYRRADSRDRHRRHRRSRSKSFIREYVSKPRRHSSSSLDNSGSENTKSNVIKSNQASVEEKTRAEIVTRKSPEISKVDIEVLNKLNEDSFAPKPFSSSSKSKKILDNIVIDLKKQTIKVPEVEPVEPDSIFHHSLFLNEEARMEKWIKELYGYRQKALQQGLKNCEK